MRHAVRVGMSVWNFYISERINRLKFVLKFVKVNFYEIFLPKYLHSNGKLPTFATSKTKWS